MINYGLTILIASLLSLCRLRITTQLRSGAVDKMAGIFTKCIWQPCICQPKDLKIRKNTGGAANGGPLPTQAPLRIATGAKGQYSSSVLEQTVGTSRSAIKN